MSISDWSQSSFIVGKLIRDFIISSVLFFFPPISCFSCWYVFKMSGMGENTSDPSRAETRKRKECPDQLGPRLDACWEAGPVLPLKATCMQHWLDTSLKYCVWFFSLTVKPLNMYYLAYLLVMLISCRFYYSLQEDEGYVTSSDVPCVLDY